jgi:HD superfamily phosphodiesterase
MDLTGIIESAEEQYKQILEGFFISIYKENSISSHGLNHHRRVWKYSRELLTHIPLKTSNQSKLVHDLIIASYLHDIGMSVDPGIRHGKYSREICSRFLAQNPHADEDFSELLDAVENHDNKDYSGDSVQNDLLKILSISDDLDAFGITGIYRYSEIYLIRGVSYENIGMRIIENGSKRFDNILRTSGLNDEFIDKHRQRYNTLVNFFCKYNEQLPSYSFGTSEPAGHCGVIELIGDIIKNKTDLKVFYNNVEKYKKDSIIEWFFAELMKELDIK